MNMDGSLLQAVCALFLVFIAVKLYLQIFLRVSHKLPPAPRALPLIGHFHFLSSLPQKSFMKLSKKYGHIMLLQLGSKRALVVSDVEIVKELFTSLDSIFVSRSVPTFGQFLLYNGKNVAFAPHGDYWREMKKLCTQNLLTNKQLTLFESSRLEEIEKAMMSVSKAVDARRGIPIRNLLSDIVFNMMMRMAMMDVDLECPEVASFKRALEEGAEFLTMFFFTDFFPSLRFLDWFKVQAMKRIQQKRDMFLKTIIAKKLKEITASSSLDKLDFIDMLVRISLQHDLLTTEAIMALTMDMIGGAFHPSPGFMEWVFVEVMRHPEVLRELQKELAGVVPPGQGHVTESELHKLTFLQAVITETFRVHPPGPLLFPRLSTQSAVVSGYTVPENTELLVNVYATSRDPQYWEDPLEFKPWRFLGSKVDLISGQSFNLIPFGSGRRSCPGASFVLLHVQLILANLFHSFNWELEEEAPICMEERFHGTLVKAKPLKLIPKLKHSVLGFV